MKTEIYKKAVGWLAAGALFGAGLVVASMFTLRLYIPEYSGKEFVEDYISGEEEKIGVSCKELNNISLSFIDKKITPLIQAGLEGKDWVAMASPDILEKVKELEDKTLVCSMVQGNALREGIEVEGMFEKQRDLYGALSVFLTSWGETPASTSKLKPGAFEKVEELYLDITNGSS